MRALHLPLILGSSSPFRRELLERLQLTFQCHSPDIDEQRLADESADALVLRLASAKADAVAEQFPPAFVIGSDQVAVTAAGTILGKPGDATTAVAQLMASSGTTVTFHTGLCLLNSDSGRRQTVVEHFSVRFRAFTEHEARRYVAAEQPLNCAGSFKSEGLGITLFDAMEGRDPNSLIGLPLIALCNMLRAEGVALP